MLPGRALLLSVARARVGRARGGWGCCPSALEALLAPLPAAARVRAPNDGGHVVATITPWQLT